MKSKLRNNLYLLFQWLVVGLLFLFLLAGFTSLVLNEGAIGIVIAIISLSVTVLMFFILMKKIRNQNAHFMKEPTPKPYVEYVRSKVNKGPNSDAISTEIIATVFSLYGQFDNAREALENINWVAKPPLIQAFQKYVLAEICYLEQGNYQEGLLLAREAQKLAVVGKAFPGTKKSNLAYEALIEIGELLSNQEKVEVVVSLEKKFRETNYLILKLIIAWALARFYNQNNNPDKAKEMLSFCQSNAPYCKPLFTNC